MPEKFTLAQAKAYFVERGLEFTPTVEIELRKKGLLVDAAPSLEGAPATLAPVAEDRDPRFAYQDAIPVNKEMPYGRARAITNNPLYRYLEGLGDFAMPAVQSAQMNPHGPPEGWNWVASKLGQVTGMLASFGAGGVATAPLKRHVMRTVAGAGKYAPLAPVAGNIAGTAPLFAAHGAAHPGSPMERAGAAAKGVEDAVLWSSLPGLPGIGKAVKNPATKWPTLTGTMAAKGVAEGQEPGEAAVDALLFNVGMKAAGAAGKGKPSDKYKGLAGANKVAVPGSKASELNTEFRSTKDLSVLVERIRKGELRAKASEERIREHEAEIRRERKYGNMPEDPAEIKAGARARADRELLPRELADWIDAQAQAVAPKAGKPHSGEPSASPLNNIPAGKAQIIDPTRLLQGLGGGEVGYKNPLDRFVLRPNQEANLTTWEIRTRLNSEVQKLMGKIKKDSPEDIALDKALDAKPDKMSTAEFFASEQGRAILAEVPTEGGRSAVVSATGGIRKYYQKRHAQLNDVSVGSGGDPVPYHDAYTRTLEQRPGTFDLKGKAGKAAEARPVSTGNSSGNPEFFNPVKLARTGKTENRQYSAWRALDDYTARFAESIGHQTALSNNMPVARYLEAKGFTDAATILKNYTQSVYNRQPYGMNASISELANSGGLTGTAASTLRWHRVRLNDAVFLANIGWNLAVQPSSAALAGARGARPATRALATMTEPEFRKFVDSEVYTQIAKNKDMGGVVSEGVGGDPVAQDSAMPKSKWQKTRAKLQVPASTVERETGYYSAAVGYHQGKMLGLKGRELIDFMSDTIAKTQSVYDRYGRAEFLNSKEMHGILPFQSFATEVMNSNRELAGRSKIGNYKLYEGKGSKAGYTARQIAGMMIANSVAQIIAGRELYDEKAFVPFLGYITGESTSNPGSLFSDLARVPGEVEKGRYGTAFSKVARHYLPAGVAMSRIAQTIESMAGAGKYQIKGREVPQALIFGPFSTETADEYYNGKDEELFVPQRNYGGRGRGGGGKRGR